MNPEQNFHEKCICQVCNCGKHKCPRPHAKGDFTTSYGKDYTKPDCVDPRQPRKQQPYEAKHYDPKDLVSQYQNNYVPKSASRQEVNARPPKNFVLPESGFQGESSYTDSYKGFDGKYQDLRAQIIRKMGDKQNAPFEGESTYNANYMGAATSPPQKVTMKGEIQLPKDAFQGESTYSANYIEKYRGRPEAAERPHSRKDLIKNDNNFSGLSNYAASYLGQSASKNEKHVPRGELSLGNHQFQGESNYNSSYKGMRPEQRALILPGSGTPVIPPGNFQGDSTYSAHYQSTNGASKQGPYRPKETPLAQGAFNGVSTYNDHYLGANNGRQDVCPAVSLNAPSYHLLDQQHLKYNANLKMWT